MSRWLIRTLSSFTLCLILPVFLGCNGGDETASSTSGKGSGSSGSNSGSEERAYLEEYPDVLHVDVMTEVAGIPIPRVDVKSEVLELGGSVPVDVGNLDAEGIPSEPVKGGRIVVRMTDEPKTMNPITESSAVQSIMSDPYLMQGLAYQHPETFEFEPMMAKHWIAEDSIKLSPAYQGYERFVSLEGEQPATSLEVIYPKTEEKKEPHQVKLTTYGADKKPLANVWVGAFPMGELAGAPKNGYHSWSDADGRVVFAGMAPGKYEVRTGYEVIGVAEETGEGGLRVTAASPKSALKKMLGEQPYLELAKNDYVDIQRGTVYTYELDDRVKWSDGTPYSTRDLVFAYHVINNRYVDGDSIRVYYENVIRCDPLDDHTIQMQYRMQYFKAFEVTASLPALGPPWHLFERFFKEDGLTLTMEKLTDKEEESQKKVSVHGLKFGEFFNSDPRYNRAPMGTGPYVIDAWVDNDRLVLKRNKNYWTDQFQGYLDEIVFKFIIEDNAALLALKSGDIDFYYRMTAEQAYETLSPEPDWFKDKYVKASWYIPSFSYLGWNSKKPMFKDRETRIALSLLLDLDDFLKKKLYGQGVLVSGSAYYFAPAYDQAVKPIGYDPQTARDLLEEAGWADTDGDGILDRDGQKFEFTLLTRSGSKTTKILAGILQESCKSVGIELHVQELEWASFLENVMNRKFDAVTLGWMSPLESDPYQIWHSSQANEPRSSNHVAFADEQADELIEQVRVTLDKNKRSAIFHSLHRILDREQPYTFLYTGKDQGAYHKRFRGVKWYRVRPGFDLTEWYVPKELQ